MFVAAVFVVVVVLAVGVGVVVVFHLNWHFARYREFWAGRNSRLLIAWVDRKFDSHYGEDDLAHSTVSSILTQNGLTRPNLWATPPNKVIDHPHLVQSSILTQNA